MRRLSSRRWAHLEWVFVGCGAEGIDDWLKSTKRPVLYRGSWQARAGDQYRTWFVYGDRLCALP